MLTVALLIGTGLASLNRIGVWRTGPYLVLGAALWATTVVGGLHGSFAGMATGLLVGARSPRREVVERTETMFRAFRQSPMVQVGRSLRRGVSQASSVNERL